jgi:succinate-acetate transporter protein
VIALAFGYGGLVQLLSGMWYVAVTHMTLGFHRPRGSEIDSY